jgi:hypothetical protein
MVFFSAGQFPEPAWVQKGYQALPLFPKWQTPGEDKILRIRDSHEFN